MATLGDLRTQLASLFHRSYTDTQADIFINAALERTSQVLYAVQAETSSTWNAASPELPLDYAAMRTVWQDWSGRQVELKPISPLEASRWTDTTNGRSLGYIVSGAEASQGTGAVMTVYPASTADCTIVYWRKPAALTGGGSKSHYLTDNYARIVLYGAAVEAALWERDMQSKQAFELEYAAAVDQANQEAERARYGAAPVAASHYQAPGGITRGM